ncbi:MAG: hypothetical protein Q7U51_09790 [Methanoregula sp.]|nr:hypothetical protein [Methanoregula sp.]
MKNRFIALILVVQLAVISAGCLSPAPALPPTQTPLPATLPTPESTIATIPPGGMALQLTDVPPDYLIKDRTVIAYSEVSQIAHDLGWQQGYRVTFYRMNREKDDLTGIRQSISVYPPENMNKVYAIESEGILSNKNGTTRYEIPFPAIGDKSMAFRETRIGDPLGLAVYTVIFKKKNVFETISMGGTTTDYEILKDVVRKAADKIR